MITNLLKNCQKQFVQKVFACILACAMIATVFAPIHSEAAIKTVNVYYNGSKTITAHKVINYTYENKKVGLGNTPIIMVNGYGMAPYTMTFVKNGPKVKHSYNTKKGILILKYNGITLKMQNKSKTAYVNGKKHTLSIAPVFVKYVTTKKTYFMVPMRKTCEFLGLNYTYNSATVTSSVTVPKKVTTNPVPDKKPEVSEPDKKPVLESTKPEPQATIFKNMTTSQYIQYMGPIAKADYNKTGVLASVTLAQSILESGWGKSELAQKANNMFGMKISLSGNIWSGSTWDGHSQYVKQTGEEYDGVHVVITAAFRSYPSVAKSVADHSAYLLGAKNGSVLRYAGLTKTKSYKTQIQIIKDGGYATSSSYVASVCNLIEQYNLSQWDK